VHENEAFQDIYDYKGGQFDKHRLDRKKEEVSNNYNPRTHLFQKIYYHRSLTLDDETKLRTAFYSANSSHETIEKLSKVALFVGFWPAAWQIARQTRPVGVAIFAGAYYFGLYKQVVQPFNLQNLQNSLNSSAKPFAQKYGVDAE
jgi:hypothetical protein